MEQHTPAAQAPAAFPFQSRFVTVSGHSIHYVEEGHGDPILFIHGNPTWSYLWRNVLPAVARETGRRGVAIDLLGFGKSDKPALEYSVALHYRILEGVIERLGLTDVVLVGTDWGGPLATAYAVRHSENVSGLALMETFLWPMTWAEDFDPRFRRPFKLLRSPVGFVMISVMNMMVKKLLPHLSPISDEVHRRYLEPFPTVASRRAMQVFPKLLPIEGEPKESYDLIAEIDRGLSRLKMPLLWIKASPGAILSEEYPKTLRHLDEMKRKLPHLVIKEFGPGRHFLAEDNPERLSSLLVEWMRDNATASPLRPVRPVEPRA